MGAVGVPTAPILSRKYWIANTVVRDPTARSNTTCR
jgi:hypothetical protein